VASAAALPCRAKRKRLTGSGPRGPRGR
jgi:hypothetical protein